MGKIQIDFRKPERQEDKKNNFTTQECFRQASAIGKIQIIRKMYPALFAEIRKF